MGLSEASSIHDKMSNGTDISEKDWGQEWVYYSRTYVLPTLIPFGILFNVTSVVVLLKKRVHLKRSLARFFAFLNISDT